MSHFTPAFFQFLTDLKRHNNRAWFAKHRERYVRDVEAPMLRFITDVGVELPRISPMVADPRRSGGSMYRIYRDTRFSADKSPYKTWAAAHFRHRRANKTTPGPGFYLHLGPTERFGGGGIYHPEMPMLTRIRRHIVESPSAWAAVRKTGVEIEGDALKRAPAGFDAAHRFVEDLKRKDFYAGVEFTEREVVAPTFLKTYVEACREIVPLMTFLAEAVGLGWKRT